MTEQSQREVSTLCALLHAVISIDRERGRATSETVPVLLGMIQRFRGRAIPAADLDMLSTSIRRVLTVEEG